MSKTKAILFCCVFVLLATVMLCCLSSMYALSNISYAYVYTGFASDKIQLNNINVINRVDPYRVDGPNIVGDNIDLDIDLKPNETYKFSFDIVNKTDIDYLISKVDLNCLNNAKVNDYLNIDMVYEDGSIFDQDSYIQSGTKRTVYVTIFYNKNLNGIQSFKFDLDMDYTIDVSR